MPDAADRGAGTAGWTVGWTAAAVSDLATLCKAEGCGLALDSPLGRLTSMGVGGSAPAIVSPPHPDAVVHIIEWMSGHGLPWKVLGGGSNLLVGDAGVDEVVLSLDRLTSPVRFAPPLATFPAGLATAQTLRETVRRGFDGLVWATGLPGTIGGAAAGNAGCWGGEMAEVVAALDVVCGDARQRRLESEELDWSYRNLDLEQAAGPGATIVGVAVRLSEADPAELERRYQELQELKRRRQPVGARNSGCIFRNPEGEQTAGQLLDAAGCKGLRVGDAEVSTLHSNFIINHGGATAADVEALITTLQQRVAEAAGVHLQPEIRRW